MSGHCSSHLSSRCRRLALVPSLALVGALALPAAPAHAAVTNLYVDQHNPSCTNSGSGTTTRPFCTIGKAAAVATAGQTVFVSSGTYNEQVIPANNGTSTAPISYQAAPGATVTVGNQTHAFTVSKTWIVISGFTVSGTTSYGIYLKGAANVTLSGNRVTASGLPVSGKIAQGIYIKDTTDSHVVGNVIDHNSDSGIYLTTGARNIELRGNMSFANARQYTRAAAGIDVRSPGNLVIGNVVHDNEDSGIQLYNGASGTLAADNLSYRNGDHGIDVLNSPNTVIVGNTVYRNTTAGINIEGATGTSASSGATVANNISVDNALTSTTTKGNIRVDANSVTGTTVNYDLLYLSSTGTMGTWGAKTYPTLAAFSTASGQETHGLQASPDWVSANQSDFHLTADSPAIDSATSLVAGEQLTDLDGASRIDDPATPNTGVGPRRYDDRGAFEYQPGQSPVAVLTVSPTGGTAPVMVTADASGSTGSHNTTIASYDFAWGDGSTTGEQSSPTATHTFDAVGSHEITVTVTDTDGKSATASQTVHVASADDPPVAALSISPQSGPAPLAVTADASASSDPDGLPIASYRFDFGDGVVVGPQAGATATHTYTTAGSYPVTVTVTDAAGQSGTASKPVTVQLPSEVNLIGNSGFETDTSGWNNNGRAGITLTRVAGGHTGGWAVQLSNTTGTTQPDCTMNDSPNWIKTSQASVYTAGLWVRGSTAGAVVKIRLREYNGPTFVNSATAQVTLTTNWQQVKVVYTPQVVGSTLDLTAYTTTSAPGTCFIADDASITAG